MKKLKRAFTLAELLLCIGIIGIVSAMGMVITKHTTDKAYQLYYYTGYINLYNAIAEAKLQGATNATDTMSKAMDFLKVDNTTSGEGVITTECANGITYSYNIPLNVENSSTENTMYKNVFITMRVPAAKTRTNGGFQEVRLYYSYDSNTLIPLAPEEGSTAPDLQTRRDLLPAYIDDGKVGRNNVIDRTNFTYEKPIYGSFKDAFCSLKDPGYEEKYGDDIVVISCAAGTYTDIRRRVDDKIVNGVLKIASPQKAH